MNSYKEVGFRIEKGKNRNLQFRPELELLFIIDGSCDVMIKETSYHLDREECLLINSGVPHSISFSEDTIIASSIFSHTLLSRTTSDKKHLFLFHTAIQRDAVYLEMLQIIKEIIYQELMPTHKTECYQLSLLLKLMDYLIEHYQIDINKETAAQTSSDLRINQLMQYVAQNYKGNISLSDIAEEMFVSKSTLSRLFKKQTGAYFADYVNQIRIRSAMQDLLHTDKTITRIAMDNGFSNPSAFHRVFTGYYDQSPSDFKKEQKEALLQLQQEKELLKERLRHNIEEAPTPLTFSATNSQTKTQILDTTRSTPFVKKWNTIINAGSVHTLSLANIQYHVVYLAENLGFTHFRLWNVFSKKLMITDGIHGGVYNFENLDAIFDFLVNNHLHPFLDFANRPNTALSAEGQSIFFDEDGITFQSQQLWEDALNSFITHMIIRYGKEEVEQWIFELSYDPIHIQSTQCYLTDKYDHFEAYRIFHQTIKFLLPNAQVGGSSFLTNTEDNHIEYFLRNCKKTDCIPNFISCILFPYDTVPGDTPSYRRTLRKDYEIIELEKLHNLLKTTEMTSCKVYVSEFNNSLSNRNYLNDSCYRATFLAKKLTDMSPLVDQISLWMASDWISNYFDTSAITNGGSGFLTKSTICKPAYYTLFFLNQLGETLIQKGENYIATSKGGYSIYILCFNYKEYNSNYYMHTEHLASPDDVNKMFQDSDPLTINFTLENMEDQTDYIIKRRKINQTAGSLLGEWKKFQYYNDLSHNDIKQMRSKCTPDTSLERQTSRDQKLHIQLTLESHEISLLHIYKER